jgi:hypothetical protein
MSDSNLLSFIKINASNGNSSRVSFGNSQLIGQLHDSNLNTVLEIKKVNKFAADHTSSLL